MGIMKPDIDPERKRCQTWRVYPVDMGDGKRVRCKMVIDPAGWVTLRKRGARRKFTLPLHVAISAMVREAQRRECEQRLGTVRERNGGADSGRGDEAEGGGSVEGHGD